MENEINSRIQNVFTFIDECGFEDNSRVWKKADLFSLIIELDVALNIKGLNLQPIDIVERIQNFYVGIDEKMHESSIVHSVYYKAALQATNDKLNRIRRGLIIGSIIEGKTIQEIELDLNNSGLL